MLVLVPPGVPFRTTLAVGTHRRNYEENHEGRKAAFEFLRTTDGNRVPSQHCMKRVKPQFDGSDR
jgi:hypothetical protein